MWQTFGHQNVKTILDRFIEREIFPHALLFVGPSSAGKRSLAIEYARRVLGPGRSNVNSDILLFDADASDIEATRQFLQSLSLTPSQGQRKVAIIDNIDAAGPIISNALLKTLEEPSASTSLILIAGTQTVLPTIISRCQVLHFNRLSQQDFVDFVKTQPLPVSDEMIALSSGLPGRLVVLLSDPAAASTLQANIDSLQKAMNGTVSDQLTAVAELAELETDELARILRVWLDLTARTLGQQPAAYALLNRITEALNHTNGTFNKKLVLQRLLLQPA